MSEINESLSRAVPMAIVNSEVKGASPQAHRLVQKIREEMVGSPDPLEAFRKVDNVVDPEELKHKAETAALQQLGDLSKDSPEVPNESAQAEELEKYKDFAVAVGSIENAASVDDLDTQTKDMLLNTMISYLSQQFPGFGDFLSTLSSREQQEYVKSFFNDREFVAKLKSRLTSILDNTDTAFKYEQDARTAVQDSENLQKDITGNIYSLSIVKPSTSLRLDQDKLKEIDLKNESDFRKLDLSQVITGLPNGMKTPEDWFKYLTKNKAKGGKGMSEEAANRFLAAQYTSLKEAQEKLAEEAQAKRESNRARDKFKRSLVSMAGESAVEFVEEKIASNEEAIRKVLIKAQSQVEVDAQSSVDFIDTAWKDRRREGDIVGHVINRRKVRKMRRMLFRNGIDDFFSYALKNADLTSAQIEAIEQLQKTDPDNEKLAEIKETAASLVIRDYLASGGKIKEKELEAIANSSDQGWLENVIKKGINLVPGAKKKVEDAFGDDIKEYIDNTGDKKGFLKRLGKRFGWKGVLFLLLVSLGVGGAVYFSPAIAGYIASGLKTAGVSSLAHSVGAAAEGVGIEGARSTITGALNAAAEPLAKFATKATADYVLQPTVSFIGTGGSAAVEAFIDVPVSSVMLQKATIAAAGTAGTIGATKIVGAVVGK